MSLLDIYKAKKLGVSTGSLFGDLFGKSMEPSYEWITESVPYSVRTVADGSNVGQQCIDEIVGGTLGWNQMLKKHNFANTKTQNGITFTNNGDGTVSVSGAASARCDFALGMLATTAEHIYLLNDESNVPGIYIGNSTWGVNSKLHKQSGSGGNVGMNLMIKSGTAISGTVKCSPKVVDLTQLFGSTIANYIYSLEQSTAGAGVAWFKKIFPKEFYTNSETLQSVNVSAHITRDADNNIIGNYSLDSSLTLRGIAKIDNGKLYYDGDIYTSDGTVTRKYGERAYQSGDATDGSTMITDGTTTVYKLDTPVIETADPFTNPQAVIKNGTEEYVDYSASQGIRDVSIPVGHNTKYQLLAE